MSRAVPGKSAGAGNCTYIVREERRRGRKKEKEEKKEKKRKTEREKEVGKMNIYIHIYIYLIQKDIITPGPQPPTEAPISKAPPPPSTVHQTSIQLAAATLQTPRPRYARQTRLKQAGRQKETKRARAAGFAVRYDTINADAGMRQFACRGRRRGAPGSSL
jgi:hypothetical protein